MTDRVPREMIQKNINARVIALAIYRLMLIDIYIKFFENILYRFKVTERTRFLNDKIPREIAQKVKMQELWFLRPARQFMFHDLYVKFREGWYNGFQAIGEHYFVTDRQTDGRTKGWTDRQPPRVKTICLPHLARVGEP